MDRNSIFMLPEDSPRTFDKDDTLPPLPLPKLEDTMNRYYENLKPFATEDELKGAEKLIKDFINNEGKKLHSLLEQRAANSKNWLEKWWEDYAYLSFEMPLIPYCLMGTALVAESVGVPETPENFQKSLSLVVYHSLEFWLAIREEKLRPPTNPDGSIIFSANLYRRLYNTVRTPGKELDKIDCYFKTAREGRAPSHFVVFGNNRIFIVDGVQPDGKILTLPQVYKCIQIIDAELKQESTNLPVPLLTHDDRKNWAKNREMLREVSVTNKESLELIESAIFTIAIDDRTPRDHSETTKMALSGGYTTWADKSATTVMFRNGRIGAMGEHACYDGSVSVMVDMFLLLSFLEDGEIDWSINPDFIPTPREIKFELNEPIISEIERMKGVCDSNQEVLSIIMHSFQGYGKEFMKLYKIHPDSYVQTVLQLTYHRLHNKLAPTYETATMRAYYRGRTETVRSCTVEMARLCDNWNLAKISVKEKASLFRNAAKSQNDLMIEARKGNGIDRHLFGLWCIAFENGLEIPKLYEDELYRRSGGGGNFVLSTSTLGYTINVGCVAPMVPDGYGVFYSMLRECCWVLITVYKDSPETSAEKFRKTFDEVMEEVKIVIEENEGHNFKL